VLSFIAPLSSNSQDLTSAELLNRGYVGAWTNTVQGSAGGYSGGWTPAYNDGTDTIIFGYTTASVSQTKAISSALQGTGIQVTGYNYSWKINNADSNTGTLTGVVSLKGSAGNVIESYSYNYNGSTAGSSNDNFQLFRGTQNFSQIYEADALSSISVTFTGKDSRYWAGFYGPRVRDPSLTLNYRTDPCANNPAFSPQCAGFNDLLTSINLVPYPNGVATGANTIVNSFPIATVMSSSGSGLTLHGFKYGFVYELKDPYCSSSFLGIFCTGTSDSAVAVIARAGDSNGRTIFDNTHTFVGSNTGPQEMNYQYLFPKSTNTNLMGNFTYAAAVEGNGSVYNMYAKMIVTPDPCIKNVMYSSSCTGFQEAIDKLNGTNKTDYATTGYTEPASVTAGTASAEAITYTSSPSGSTVAVTPVPPPVPPATSQSSQSNGSSSSTASVASVSAGSTSDKTSGGSPANLSFAMNLISKNAEKEKTIAMSAVATAVEQAQSAGTQAQQEAVSVATKASEASTSTSFGGSSSSSSSTTMSDTKSASSGGGLMLQSAGVGGIQLQNSGPMQSSVNVTSTSTTQITQQSFAVQANYSIVPIMQVASVASTLSGPTFSETNQSTQSSQSISIDRTSFEIEAPSNSTGFITDRTNPLREIIDAQPIIAGTSIEQQMSTVKKEVAINEAAGGVDIGKMAIAPMGYNTYLTLAIKDVSFYVPRDIYPKQNNVDNARALRQMSSDRLHQEMINQQYQGK
jgi:hypothetical protein